MNEDLLEEESYSEQIRNIYNHRRINFLNQKKINKFELDLYMMEEEEND